MVLFLHDSTYTTILLRFDVVLSVTKFGTVRLRQSALSLSTLHTSRDHNRHVVRPPCLRTAPFSGPWHRGKVACMNGITPAHSTIENRERQIPYRPSGQETLPASAADSMLQLAQERSNRPGDTILWGFGIRQDVPGYAAPRVATPWQTGKAETEIDHQFFPHPSCCMHRKPNYPSGSRSASRG